MLSPWWRGRAEKRCLCLLIRPADTFRPGQLRISPFCFQRPFNLNLLLKLRVYPVLHPLFELLNPLVYVRAAALTFNLRLTHLNFLKTRIVICGRLVLRRGVTDDAPVIVGTFRMPFCVGGLTPYQRSRSVLKYLTVTVCQPFAEYRKLSSSRCPQFGVNHHFLSYYSWMSDAGQWTNYCCHRCGRRPSSKHCLHVMYLIQADADSER